MYKVFVPSLSMSDVLVILIENENVAGEHCFIRLGKYYGKPENFAENFAVQVIIITRRVNRIESNHGSTRHTRFTRFDVDLPFRSAGELVRNFHGNIFKFFRQQWANII